MNRDYLTGEATAGEDFDNEDLQLVADMAEAREDDKKASPFEEFGLGLASKE